MANWQHTTKERLAHIEALIEDLQPQLDRRFAELEKLRTAVIAKVELEHKLDIDALRAAITKTETASARQFDTFKEQNVRAGEVTQQRLGAIERITSEDTGARQFKASLWVALGVLVSVAYLVVVLFTAHVI